MVIWFGLVPTAAGNGGSSNGLFFVLFFSMLCGHLIFVSFFLISKGDRIRDCVDLMCVC